MNLLKKNFIYNNLFGLINVLVPLIIFPYISRVFGPIGLGKVSFAMSLATTFVIIGSLGIPIYGIREIAKVNKDKNLLSKTFFEILFIQTIWLVFTLILYFFWITYTNTFEDELVIKIVSFFHIIGVVGLINWFYQGLEKYRFITIVNFGIKISTIFLMYILIDSKEQYWLYYSILAFTTLIACFVSVFNTKKYLSFKVKNLAIKKHIKSIGVLFGTQIAIGIYTNMSIVFLKYLSTDEQVGYYTPAIRLIKISAMLITTLGIVLIPKISEYVHNNKLEECENIIKKSIKYVLFISFPIIILIWINAYDLILIFAGKNFLDSVVLLQFLTPLIFLIGMSNVFGLQILIPFHKEKLFLYSVGIGALISIPLNYLFMKNLQSLGAVYAILITELIIAAITSYFAMKILPIKYPFKSGLIYLSVSLIFIPLSLFNDRYLDGFIFIFINTFCCLFIYIIGLILLKESFFIENIWKPFLNFKFR